ncbi:hypothetical protein D3C81_1948120 [compost metagenome]
MENSAGGSETDDAAMEQLNLSEQAAARLFSVRYYPVHCDRDDGVLQIRGYPGIPGE